jgi:transcription initiation factor TFIIIB Brf1 subunit/transcription initiation factor TFIIB
MAMNSGLNQCIIEEAKYMYKKVSEVKSSGRTKKEGMKAGAISLACKLKGVPRNCDEIAKICHMKNSKTLRKSIKSFEEICNNLLMKEKGIIPGKNKDSNLEEENINGHILDKSEHSSDDSSDDSNDDEDNDSVNKIQNYYGKLHRFVSALSLDDKFYDACKLILEYIEINNYLDKHNPLSRITSIIFYVSERFNININKHQIIQICDVSDVTINKCYQKLMKFKNELNNISIES